MKSQQSKPEVLTNAELLGLNSLNVSQIISFYPEYVIRAIKSELCESVSDVLLSLGLNPNNTNARNKLSEFATSKELTLPVYNRTANLNYVQPKLTKEAVLERLIKGEKTYGSSLRKWIIQFDIIPYSCSGEHCQLENLKWGAHTISLEIDHINGDNTDNRLDNLRWLCPICHSITPTFKSRNSRAYKNALVNACKKCHEPTKLNQYCRICIQDKDIINALKLEMVIPSVKDLIEEVGNHNISYVSNKYFLDRKTLKRVLASPDKYEHYPKRNKQIKINQKPAKLSINVPKSLKRNSLEMARIAEVEANQTSNREQQAKANYPPITELLEMLSKDSFESVARDLGVTSNAIRKYLKVRGVTFEARRKPNGTVTSDSYSCSCGEAKKPEAENCHNCYLKNKTAKANSRFDNVDIVVEMLKSKGASKAAEHYGTSRKSLYDFLKRHNIDYRNL